MIDTSVGGIFLKRTTQQAFDMLDGIAINSYQWSQERMIEGNENGGPSTDAFANLAAQVSLLSKQLQELVAKHFIEEGNMAKMSFEGQHERLPSLLKMIREEDLNYKEDVTSRSKDELEKITKVEDDAKNLRVLVVKEVEPTSPKSHKKIKYEVIKTILEMAPWGEKHEVLRIEEVTPMSKVEEGIVRLNEEK